MRNTKPLNIAPTAKVCPALALCCMVSSLVSGGTALALAHWLLG